MISVPVVLLGDMLTDRLISDGLCYFRANLQFVFILQAKHGRIIAEGNSMIDFCKGAML